MLDFWPNGAVLLLPIAQGLVGYVVALLKGVPIITAFERIAPIVVSQLPASLLWMLTLNFFGLFWLSVVGFAVGFAVALVYFATKIAFQSWWARPRGFR